MVFCKKCGYEGAYLGKSCPVCATAFKFSDDDITELKEIVESASTKKEHETVVEGCHILADFGDTDGEREYAKLLERGDGVSIDLDAATEYYRRAAEKGDAFSAYRYSVLISRMNEAIGNFWLEFSSFLGYRKAFLDASRIYRKETEYDLSNHYLYLAAMSDDTDAIVEIAEKYYTGDGIEQSHEYAKWYMDKLSFPPLYAIRLAIKLRGTNAAEPPNIAISDKKQIINTLLGKARKLSLDAPIFMLTSELFDLGEMGYGAELGEMYIEGRGTEKSVDEGIRAFSRAAASGSSRAYISLGVLYYEGAEIERNQKFALECLERAASLGSKEAYELLGDIYHSSEFDGRDIAVSAKMYKKAALLGSESAEEKHGKILKFRNEYFESALQKKMTSPKEAFKLFYVADAMGHPKAKLHLAHAYSAGIGVKRDTSQAFLYYKKAAQEGCEEAFFPLGLCYSQGFGCAFDFDLALENLSRAAALGYEEAHKEIISLCENKKRALARKLYSKGIRLIFLGKFDTARAHLELSHKFGNARAAYALGCLLEFERLDASERERAYELYKEAEKGGFYDNRSSFKLKILKMIKRA
ncbi:MAG: sel1 repeat family protein [Clostridia bacterium]|nr:sel1 repeat family protein [Clostridia bacterium]